tara:strand:- start:60 stop:431 length:372 start_codon:yes stop_codon:yes gene_type:complete
MHSTNGPTNLNNVNGNPTTKYFNNFFKPTYAISPETNDAIVSYFQGQTGDLESARLLAQAVYDTALTQREDPLVVLDQFRALPQGELSPFLALYLNTSRVPTSLLGVQNTPKTNSLVTRTIIV